MYAAHCNNGDMRLLGGEEEWEGRLEVCHNGRWGTVGVSENEQWSHFNNETICGYFGYEATSKLRDKKKLYRYSIHVQIKVVVCPYWSCSHSRDRSIGIELSALLLIYHYWTAAYSGTWETPMNSVTQL